MKYLIVVAVITLVSFPLIKGEPDIEQISKKCAEEQGMKEDGDYTEDDPKFKCFTKCLYTELGVVDKEGNLDLAKFENFMSRKYTDDEKKAIKNCEAKNKNSNLCDQVSNTQTCIFEDSLPLGELGFGGSCM